MRFENSCIALKAADPAAMIVLVNLALLVTILIWVRKYPNTPGIRWFSLTLCSIGWWLITVLLELAADSLDCKVFFARIAWPGIVLTPTFWAFFLFEYALARVTPMWTRFVGICVMPGLITIAALAVPYYDGFYTADTRLIVTEARSYAQYAHGPVFYVAIGYIYVVVMSSTFIALAAARRATSAVRGFVQKLLAVTLLPIMADLTYLLGGVTVLGMDPTPLIFSISLVIVFWLMMDRRWIDVTAIGRDLMYDNTSDPIILAWNDGTMIDANPEAQNLFGLPQRNSDASLLDVEGLGQLVGQLQEVGHQADMPVMRVGQRSFLPRVQPLTLLHADQHLGWAIGLVDVSAHEDAAEKARAADLSKTQFLSTVSHELRTPLTVIKGALELLMRDEVISDPKKLGRLLALARENTVSLSRLVDDLLDMQQLDKAEFSMTLERIELNSLCKQALSQIESYQTHKPIEFRYAPCPSPLFVEGDRHRLGQVLANILSNAIKFTKNPGLVSLRLEQVDDQARILISDNGIGIPANARDKVFGRFTQVDSSDTRNRGGSGLGMHITDQIIKQHGGTIDYQSVIGEETTFIVTLPLDLAGSDATAQKSRAALTPDLAL